jgi:hypothetical protein
MNSSNTRLEKVLGKAPECTGRVPGLPLSGWDLCLGVSGREIVPLCEAGCACMLLEGVEHCSPEPRVSHAGK